MSAHHHPTLPGFDDAATPATKPTNPDPAAVTRRLSVAYGAHLALDRVDLTVPRGVILGIVGPNGAGKSTLLKAILGLVPALHGSVEVLGSTLDDQRHRVAYVPQSSTVDWDFPATVADVVLMGTYGRLGWLRRPGTRQRRIAAGAMEQAGIADLASRRIGELSGGQRQRAFLARALAQQADLYLLDEPFQGVDARTQQAILQVLRGLRRSGRTVVLVHHDIATVRAYCDHVALINRSLIAHGPAAHTLTPANIASAYQVPADGAMVLGST